jgi:hypothetical protein
VLGRIRFGVRIVHHLFVNTGKLVLACLIMCGFTAQPSLDMSLSAGSVQSSTPSPAEIVASRFPSGDTLPVIPATFSTASAMSTEQWETFNQGTLSPAMAADPAWPTAVEATEPPISGPAQPSEPAQQPPSISEPVKPEPPKAQTANAAPRQVKGRSSSVLNDAQIASIKKRLNLTAEQAKMWPAVEAALRKVVYTKNAMDPQGHAAQAAGVRTAYIDPDSTEIQQLKYAALPLIMRLNDEQKREVKMLAYVMGLESVASQF